MIKTVIMAAMLAFGTAATAQQYAKSIHYADIELRSWTAISNLTATAASGGTLVGTYSYRVGGTNLSGRIPATAVTNVVCSTNRVTLQWKRKDGLMAYVVERSRDGGVTWTNWAIVSPSVTNFTDYGTNAWNETAYEGVYASVPVPALVGAAYLPTTAPDGVTLTYSGGVLRVPVGVFDPAGSAAAVSNAAWAQGWITAASIPAASNYATWSQGIKADNAYPANNPSNYLRAESDPLWAAWRTNAAAGSTNAILPTGALVDIGGLFGIKSNLAVNVSDTNTLRATPPHEHANVSGLYSRTGADSFSFSYSDALQGPDPDCSLTFADGVWRLWYSTMGAGPNGCWTNATLTGAYYPDLAYEPTTLGTVSLAYEPIATNVITSLDSKVLLQFDKWNGKDQSAFLTNEPLWQSVSGAVVSGAARGAMALTNVQFIGTGRVYLGTDTNAPWFQGLGTTNIQFGAGTNRAIFGAPWLTAETDPIALLPNGTRAMTGNLNMGGFSVTNISTGSVAFANGTELSSPSNGTLAVNGAAVYTTVNPPPSGEGATYTFDPIYFSQSGSRVSMQHWLPDMVLENWYQMQVQGIMYQSGSDYENATLYTFRDENGILPAYSSGYAWANPWYVNSEDIASPGVGSAVSLYREKATFDPSSLPIGSAARSIFGWVMRKDSGGAGDQGFVVLHYGTGAGRCFIGAYPGRQYDIYAEEPGSQFYGGSAPSTNEWHHFGITHDGSTTLRVWFDGANVATDEAFTFNSDTGEVDAAFGSFDSWGGTQASAFDDLVVFDRALSTQEVESIYSSGTGSTINVSAGPWSNGLVYAWTFDSRASGELSTGSMAVAINIGTNSSFVDGVVYGYQLTNAPSDIGLTGTNTMLPYIASNAMVTVLASSASTLGTNDAYAYVVNLTSGTTNAAAGWELASTTDYSNALYRAVITNSALGTNLAAGVWVSSNVSVTVKGIGAVYAP